MHFSKLALAAAVGVASAESICDKYTTALLMNNTAANQYALVTLLVKTAAVGNFTGGSMNPTLPGSKVMLPGFLGNATFMGEAVDLSQYFTGALASTNVSGMPAAVNWLDTSTTTLLSDPTSLGAAGTNANQLLTHLVQFFGVLLGCSTYGTTGFSSYQGVTSMAAVHGYMGLSEAEFGYFINQTGEAALSFGASMADTEAVAMSLNNAFGYRCAAPAAIVPGAPMEYQEMCDDSSCPLASSPVAGCTGMDYVPMSTGYNPSTATGSATIMLNTVNPSGTTSYTATTGPLASESAMASGSMAMSSGAMATGSTTLTPAAANAAPRQTAAAGIIAAGAAFAAAFL